jgi:hypothetical protein
VAALATFTALAAFTVLIITVSATTTGSNGASDKSAIRHGIFLFLYSAA